MKLLMFHNNHYIIQHLFLVVNTFFKIFLLKIFNKSDPVFTGSLLYQLFYLLSILLRLFFLFKSCFFIYNFFIFVL